MKNHIVSSFLLFILFSFLNLTLFAQDMGSDKKEPKAAVEAPKPASAVSQPVSVPKAKPKQEYVGKAYVDSLKEIQRKQSDVKKNIADEKAEAIAQKQGDKKSAAHIKENLKKDKDQYKADKAAAPKKQKKSAPKRQISSYDDTKVASVKNKVEEAKTIKNKGGISQSIWRQLALRDPHKSASQLKKELRDILSKNKVTVNGKAISAMGISSIVDVQEHAELRLAKPGAKVVLAADNSVEITGDVEVIWPSAIFASRKINSLLAEKNVHADSLRLAKAERDSLKSVVASLKKDGNGFGFKGWLFVVLSLAFAVFSAFQFFKVKNLSNELEISESKAAGLSARIASLKSDIDYHEDEAKNLLEKVERLESGEELVEAKQKIESLESTVRILTDNISTESTKVVELEGLVKRHEMTHAQMTQKTGLAHGVDFSQEPANLHEVQEVLGTEGAESLGEAGASFERVLDKASPLPSLEDLDDLAVIQEEGDEDLFGQQKDKSVTEGAIQNLGESPVGTESQPEPKITKLGMVIDDDTHVPALNGKKKEEAGGGGFVALDEKSQEKTFAQNGNHDQRFVTLELLGKSDKNGSPTDFRGGTEKIMDIVAFVVSFGKKGKKWNIEEKASA